MPGPIWHPSPSFGPRRDGLTPTLIVLHYTAMRDAGAALTRLCDPAVDVSAHYLISRDGRVWHLVEESMRAWHAGAGEWAGQDDINSRSIGIELDNRGDHPFSEPLMAALERLLPDVMLRWGIAPEGVIGHSDMAPGRKQDPGPRFDWARLARGGFVVAPSPASGPAPDAGAFRQLVKQAGFTAPAPDDRLLAAFRFRFRPWGKGAVSMNDLRILKALAGPRGPGFPSGD